MDTNLIADRIRKYAEPRLYKEDQGIGPYEFWGNRGVDKQVVTSCEADEVKVNVSDCFDEEETPASVLEEGLEIAVSLTLKGTCDSDACAEGGRRSCRGCNARQEETGEYSFKLKSITEEEAVFIQEG